MTPEELRDGIAEADYCVAEIRKHGGIVLRLPRGDQWRLHINNGQHVPTPLKFRLLELQPFVLVYLRKLAYERAPQPSPQIIVRKPRNYWGNYGANDASE